MARYCFKNLFQKMIFDKNKLYAKIMYDFVSTLFHDYNNII